VLHRLTSSSEPPVKYAALVLALSLTAFEPQDALRRTPEVGLALRKTFERSARLELTALEMTVDGGSHGDVPKPELTLRIEETFVVLDRCLEVDETRATRLARTYERLVSNRSERSAGHEGGEVTDKGFESDLEGQSVVFSWDAEEGTYGAEFEGGEGDSKLLDGLEAEIDLDAFLPPEGTAEGESWDVPAGAFGALLAPGGDLKLAAEDGEAPGAEVELARHLQGTIRATLRAADEEGLAKIDLELELSARAERELEDGTQSQSTTYALSGELAWRRAAGHFAALELSGTMQSRLLLARDVEMGGKQFRTERTFEFEGEVSYALRAEAP
jgi:hypothetical protein